MKILSNKYSMRSNSLIIRLAIISLVTLTGALWLYINGPIPVIRGTTALDEIVPFWYMIAAFPVLGMLVADLLSILVKYRFDRYTIVLFSQIFILVIISNIRLSLKIPISGHAFLFSFFIIYRIFGKDIKNTFQKAEFFITVILLLIISYIKFAWWNDPLTLSIGIVGGIALALLTAVFSREVRSQAVRR